ncbi:ABC-type metal ion transport system, periplasmic component surface antigen [Lactobacillus selangorensis]|uniref:Lipoprotein n=1 Tax=Lactobacillus selangorensis TaxID=81857 RepID=A0A0R2FL21_9LACO|nr:MetQ/NlpA family ABC transporter substrate-binding protein [Lactobacillus selangorensis]KRN29321.1 ABC-type metal ion transport system, periplasmic component surface antigen [Lactobacillus selangorensis]KRN34150.1 ABC-type metal ion transport system, periplasmic component surface antigen [Lactobacillus selangorensis]
MKKLKRVSLMVLLLLVTIVVAACGKQTAAAKTQTVKIGIIGSDEKIWKPVVQKLKKEHINLKLVTFTDYNQPNTALQQGQIDLNSYQHSYFLNNWNKAHHADLVSIGKTDIGPMRVYSNKITKLSQLKKGDKVAVPNDATNEGRALQLLANANLITLDNAKLPTKKDIKSNKSGIVIEELDATQTAHSLDDVTAAVINNGVAADANLNPKKAIATEKLTKQSEQWINIIVARKKDANNPTYKKVVKAFQTEATAKKIKQVYKGSTEEAWNLKLK